MSEPFLAEIIMFGGNFAPRGWAFCNGQILSIAQNSALFSLLGTTYGGNGQTTFGLPDFRGRVPMSAGQGPGLPPYSLGEMAGTPTVTLISTQMPAHNHPGALIASADEASTKVPGGNFIASPTTSIFAPTGGGGTINGVQTGIAGGSQPHDNMQPFTVVNFIIAVEGIFPSRN